MLKNIKVNIKVTNKNLKHYRNFYPLVSSGDSISVSVIEIPTGSHVEVFGVCDFCGKERLISYKEYNKQTNFGSSEQMEIYINNWDSIYYTKQFQIIIG